MAMGKSFARAVANPQYRKARLKANGRDFVWSAIAAAAVAAVPMLDTPVRANLESIAGYAGALNDEGPNLPDVAGLDVVGGALTALNAMREGDVEQNIQIQNARLQIGQENTITLVNDDSELALGRDHPLFASALEAKLGISIDINDVAGQVVFTPENAGEFSLDMLNSLLALGYEPLVQGYLNNAQYTEFEGEIFQHLPSIFRDDYIDGLLRSGGSYNACDGTVTLVDRLANQRVSDSVGFRERHPVTGLPADHFGTDIAVRRMRIPTMENGIVIFTGNIPGYGGTVIVDHGEGVRTLYAHFSAITVRRGQVVAEGDIVGISGNTGRGTGWHLHREVWVENPDQPGQWRVIDGEQYIGVDLGNPDTKRAAIAEVAAKLRDSVIERGMIQRASFH
ncbi:MAG: peptidoglycan DD-metalloendopeptidase family protein [Alphaproteobacteria bacterium]|nr:peptidoglycan DD-metalloendopeptidase family protein [Alphaproteobacteria bacterium]